MTVEGLSSFSLHNTAKQGIRKIRRHAAHCQGNRTGPLPAGAQSPSENEEAAEAIPGSSTV